MSMYRERYHMRHTIGQVTIIPGQGGPSVREYVWSDWRLVERNIELGGVVEVPIGVVLPVDCSDRGDEPTVNVARARFGLPPVEGGDVPLSKYRRPGEGGAA